MRRFRREHSEWRRVGDVLPVRIGEAGLAWGRGEHAVPEEDARAAPLKDEGDLRSPAGIFELGRAFGPSASPPRSTEWPWRRVQSHDVFVDDPKSPHYNHWVRADESTDRDWRSAERLSIYRLGLVVRHNRNPTVDGAGSAIVLHTHRGSPGPTLGCTAIDEGALADIIGWLAPEDSPVLVQSPGWIAD